MIPTILESVLHFLAHRRTVRELTRLDDRTLADIGLARGDIHRVATEASGAPELANMPIWTAWLSRLQRASTRAGLVRSLHGLPDHVLKDIGIPRREIEASVYRIMAETPAQAEAKAPRTKTFHISPVHGLLARIEAVTWPFRRAQESRPVRAAHSQPAANRNHTQAKVA